MGDASASDHDTIGGSQPGGSCGYGYGYGGASHHLDGLGGSHSLGLASDDEEDGEDAKLESKRARNREAARRMRQRQRQQISKLEVSKALACSVMSWGQGCAATPGWVGM